MFQLSPHVHPQPRIGALRMIALNLIERPSLIDYVDGMYQHIRGLLEHVRSRPNDPDINRESVTTFHRAALLAALMTPIDWDAPGGPQVELWEHGHDYVSFDHERLGIMFVDGRLRDEREMVYVPSGTATPQFASLIGAMARGAESAELIALAAQLDIDIDQDFITMLVERGVLDEVSAPAIPKARFAPTAGDRVTWLGHRGLAFHSGPTTVWFDPLLPARIRFRPEELDEVFPPDAADRNYIRPFGPEFEQLTSRDLPAPAAVVLGSEDFIGCDLGLLMCLPETTTIVVPAARPDRPWQVDLRGPIAKVVGNRRVIRLAHGETVSFGDIDISAMPHAGEWPPSLPIDYNTCVVRGRTGAMVVGHLSALLPEHVDAIAKHLGDRGERAVLFTLQVYSGGVRTQHGFRELPTTFLAPHRAWPWYVQVDKLFEPSPVPGVCTEVLRTLRERTGLSRYFPYNHGAPWLYFHPPHAHRFNVAAMKQRAFQRIASDAAEAGFSFAPIELGKPFEL